jgi:isopentenyl-diphosphate delta-isomerase
VTATGSRSSEQSNASGAPAPVSFASEELILVDSDDREIGHCSKLETHQGQGKLHRAFSAFLFDDRGRVLLHQRSGSKPLWPGYWTNSCCSHPRRGEALDAAVHRRLREELGVVAEALPVYKFEYHASFHDRGSEHELCHIYLARAQGSSAISAHEDEVQDWAWLEVSQVDSWVAERRDTLTPWFLMEWRELRETYRDTLDAFIADCRSGRAEALPERVG